jgi:putative tryptophan/tyrosine transport system substrate-binding protein
LAGLGLLAGCGLPPLPGREATRVRRVGFVTAGSAASDGPWIDAFVRGLRELGYVEGQSVAVEYRYGEGKTERYPALVRELIELRVEVIVTGGATATRASKQVTAEVPIVMAYVTDPVALGLVESLARPGGNVTGVSNMAPNLGTKRLELLKQAAPGLARVAVLGDPSSPANAPQWREAEGAARALGVHVQPFWVSEPDPDFAGAFSDIAGSRADALLTLSPPLISVHLERIVEFAATRRLPGMFHRREFADAGGLMSYEANAADIHRRAAGIVDKILKGAQPADLPVEQPTRFDFVINSKTAQALGLSIPSSVLQQATELIQ